MNVKQIAVWGLASKPATDDMRAAPSRTLITVLLMAGARVAAHDPVATVEARAALKADLADTPQFMGQLCFASRPMDALEAADALVIVTEWKAYRSHSFSAMRRALNRPLIVDGHNLYEPEAMRQAGFRYLAVGRGTTVD